MICSMAVYDTVHDTFYIVNDVSEYASWLALASSLGFPIFSK